MANRRAFLGIAGGFGLAAAGASPSGAAYAPRAREEGGTGRDLYELRQYQVAGPDQRDGLIRFLGEAAIPALNRIGIAPVGVFEPVKGPGPVYVLLRHSSAESVLTSTQRLLADAEYRRSGAAFLDAPAEKPAFQRVESSLLLAFKGMPTLETPVKNPGRVFQLRVYESPSVKTGQKKIEMFNDAGEIPIFRRSGLHPVFFGEAILGAKMPNLTYMLGFESEDQLKANWKTFVADPDWKRISKLPEFADKAILSGITNIVLKPAPCSQV